MDIFDSTAETFLFLFLFFFEQGERKHEVPVEFVQKGKVPRFLPFRFLNDPPCRASRNENRRDNFDRNRVRENRIGLSRGTRGLLASIERLYSLLQRERMEFFHPVVGTHTLLRRRVFNNDSNERPPASNCNLA